MDAKETTNRLTIEPAESSGVWNQALNTSSTTESASQQNNRPSKRGTGYAVDSEPPLKRAPGGKESKIGADRHWPGWSRHP